MRQEKSVHGTERNDLFLISNTQSIKMYLCLNLKTSISHLQLCAPFVFDEIWCVQSGMAVDCGRLPWIYFKKGALRAQVIHHHPLVLHHFGVVTIWN